MIQSNATNPHQTSPYRHGNILMPAGSYIADEYEPPGMGSSILQGVAVGALLAFLKAATLMFSNPLNGYNIFYPILLPFLLAGGMLFGAVEGSIIWGCMRIAGPRLEAGARAGIGMVVMAIFLIAYHVLFTLTSPYNVSGADYFFTFIIYLAYGGLFGLVGSRFHPVHQLVSGATHSQYRGSGVVLRLLVVFGLMESFLLLIWSGQQGFHSSAFMYSAVAFSHFVIATVIVFANTPFRVLANLALFVNFPIMVFILNAFKLEGQAPLGLILLVYLGLWVAFVFSRMPHETLSSIKAELRYYLID